MRLKASLAGGTKERRTLMDIEKLIEQLNGYFEGKDLKRGVALDAATALSALQAENEKLRAELEQVKRERDAAIEAANGLDKMIGRAWGGKTDMERLTYFDGGKWRLKIGDTEYSGEAVDRLAAYEDTGLEPEEIGALKSREKGLVELLNGVSCGCAVTYTRLRELAQADREGRCVVLPAKPDQTIYQWRIGDDCPSVSRLDGVQINADGEITYPIWNGYLIAEDFGRTVFLTREEAALRREQDG